MAGKTPIRPALVYAIAAGVAVFLILGVITIVVLVSSAHRDEGEDTAGPVLGEPGGAVVTGSANATTTAQSPVSPQPPSKRGKGKSHGRN